MNAMDRLIGIEACIRDAAKQAKCPRPDDIPFALGWLGEMARIAVEYLGTTEPKEKGNEVQK